MQPEIYWIPSPWPGRLAVMPRPRGGDWLEDEIEAFRHMGVDVMVSALKESEEEQLELTRESEFCQAKGLEFVSFPIADGTVPSSEKAVGELVGLLGARLAAGKSVAIHCRAGIGRCTVLAACVLASSGMQSQAAFESIQQARGCQVPDKKEQAEWVDRFAQNLLTNDLKVRNPMGGAP
jgi:protein-tyrosine phosphatase